MSDRFVALDLLEDYRSSTHQIGRDLHARLLKCAQVYHRAVGFFSSSAFRTIPRNYLEFFKCGGRLELICSEFLSASDAQALIRAVYERPTVRSRWPSLDDAFASENWSALLGYLVANDHVRVRVALLVQGSPTRMYHEKIGIFRDSENRFVAIAGSANESLPGLLENFERVDVYRSWGGDDERRRAERIDQQFRALWQNRTEGLEVIELAEACRRSVWQVMTRPETEGSLRVESRPLPTPQPEVLIPPADLELFPHQVEALAAWGRAGGRGLLEMATGAGKTLTALSAASRIYDRLRGSLAILIVAPLIHLVDQWRDVARRFGLNPIRCAESSQEWYDELDAAIFALNADRRPLLSIITTSATLAGEPFQSLMRRIRKPLMVIADEAHNYGTAALMAAFPAQAVLRLGLSATPERWMDPEGTARLRQYFGGSAYHYGLREAIRDGILTPYVYYPEVVDLEPDEMDRYLEITQQLARYVQTDAEEPEGDVAKRLLLKRARLLASARQKMPLLKKLMSHRTRDSHILVYCGDGSVSGPSGEDAIRQVSEVVRILGHELGMRCASYTAETPPAERKRLLESFADGFLQVLVAIRCLDEGVDIPVTRTAYLLASSTNPRQFIQRRGRVLRRAPRKSRAELFDVFVVPSMRDIVPHSREWEIARAMVGKQIHRAREFAELAENGPVARQRLLSVASQLDLLSYWENGA